MKLFLLGWFVLLPIAGIPIFLVDYLNNRSDWVKKHDGLLTTIAWITGMLIIYIIYPLLLHLEPNYRLFGYD
jgi:hypothetical protein